MISIDWSILGTQQRKKILTLCGGLGLAVLISISTHFIVAVKNIYRQSEIENKRNNLSSKKIEVAKIKKALNDLQKETINSNLHRRNGMYRGMDKQKLINGVYNKMNGMDDLEAWDNLRKNQKDMKYSAFSISSTPISSLYPQKVFDEYMKKYVFLPSQYSKIIFDGNKVVVSFNADFEYVAYRILAMLQNLLTGYVVVSSFSIKPVKQDIRTMLYDMKFYKKEPLKELDNRLSGEIELDWYFLRNNKGYENIIEDQQVIEKGSRATTNE